MVIITRDKFNDSRKIAGFLYCRISRIYPPYWFYVLLVGLAMWIMPGVFAPREVSFLKSFLLLPQRELPVVVVGWTLIYEVYFYIVFWCNTRFPQRKITGGSRNMVCCASCRQLRDHRGSGKHSSGCLDCDIPIFSGVHLWLPCSTPAFTPTKPYSRFSAGFCGGSIGDSSRAICREFHY